MDVFAAPELLADGKAQLAIVRHAPGCATLLAQVGGRWPAQPARLPDTPSQLPFEQRAAWGRWHRAVQARQAR
jgi:hypothetical protein